MRKFCSLLRLWGAAGLFGTKCWMRNSVLTERKTYPANYTRQVQERIPFVERSGDFAFCTAQLQLVEAFRSQTRLSFTT